MTKFLHGQNVFLFYFKSPNLMLKNSIHILETVKVPDVIFHSLPDSCLVAEFRSFIYFSLLQTWPLSWFPSGRATKEATGGYFSLIRQWGQIKVYILCFYVFVLLKRLFTGFNSGGQRNCRILPSLYYQTKRRRWGGGRPFWALFPPFLELLMLL